MSNKNESTPGPGPDLPPLFPQPNTTSLVQSPSPADPSSEDPVTRSLAHGTLKTADDDDTAPLHRSSHLSADSHSHSDPSSPSHAKCPTSPSHNRTSSTALRGGSHSAMSVLDLLRGRGQAPYDDDEDDDEEMGDSPFFASRAGGGAGGMPLGAFRAPQGNRASDMRKELRELHPYATTLGPGDVAAVCALERACFEGEAAASSEKIAYRMGVAGELTLGLFSSAWENGGTKEGEGVLSAVTAADAKQIHDGYSGGAVENARRTVLLAAVVATKSANTLAQESDFQIPESHGQRTDVNTSDTAASPRSGHNEAGRTLILHSLAVAPSYQRLGLGTILLKAYVNRIMESDVADRIAILTQQRLMPWYARMGFEERGKSDVQIAGGGWVNMVYEFAGKKGDD
ncbi:MAG: hypothetical protein Q9159_001424 [Coniocarpon cinnabarinum]